MKETLFWIAWIVVAIVSGLISYKFASKSGLDPWLAFVAGLLLPIITPAIYFIVYIMVHLFPSSYGSPIIYFYKKTSLYRKIHENKTRDLWLKKYSYILAGLFIFFAGLDNFTSEYSQEFTDKIWAIVIVVCGAYLIYQGFTKYKNEE
jgi:hypothetical protein